MQSQNKDCDLTPDQFAERFDQKSPRVASTLKSDANRINTRRCRRAAYSRYCSELRGVPRSDLPSSPRAKIFSFLYDNSNREITTIQEEFSVHEEILLYKASKFHAARKEGKAYKDKVASLKSIVKRLQEMGVAKPEKGQNKRPEEVMQQLSGIQL